MKHLDLFSGIGGFALAADWIWKEDHEIVTFVEIDKFCQKVLNKHWPSVPIHSDIFALDGNQYEEIDLLTAGFPCQPFSCAGKREGTRDDRYLWPETLRIIKEAKPSWILLENVTGLLGILEPESLSEVECKEIELFLKAKDQDNHSRTIIRIYRRIIGRIISDIKEAGYLLPESTDGTPIIPVVPACSLNAPHRRDRVWIVGNAKCPRRSSREIHNGNIIETLQSKETNSPKSKNRFARKGIDSDAERIRQVGSDSRKNKRKSRRFIPSKCNRENEQWIESWDRNWIEVASEFCGVDHGLPDRVDRLRSLGNAIVPQVAKMIMKSIKEVNGFQSE